LGWLLIASGLIPLDWRWVPVAVLGAGLLLLRCLSDRKFLLFGPLTKLQLYPTLRRRWLWIRRAAVVVVAAITFFTIMWDVNPANTNELAQRNLITASALGAMVAGFVVLITLSNYTNVIHDLRKAKQWEVLRTTDLRPREIIAGLIFGKFVLILEPVFAITPVMMILTLFGGVSPAFPIMVLAAVVALGFGLANAAVYFSLRRQTAAGAAWRCWLLYGLYVFMVIAGLSMISATPLRPFIYGSFPATWICSGCLINIPMSSPLYTSVEEALIFCLWQFIVFHGLLGLYFFLQGTRFIGGEHTEVASVKQALKLAKKERNYRPIRKPKLWENMPLAWQQAYYSLNRPQAWVVRMFTWKSTAILCGVMFGLCLIIFSRQYHRNYITEPYEWLAYFLQILLLYTWHIAFFGVFVPTMFRSVRAILREKKADTWDAVLLTPISRKLIVRQKWIGLMISDLPTYLLMASIITPLTILGRGNWYCLAMILVGTLAVKSVWSAVGLYIGSFSKTAFESISILAVVVIAYIIAGVWASMIIFDRSGSYSSSLPYFVSLFPPGIGYIAFESSTFFSRQSTDVIILPWLLVACLITSAVYVALTLFFLQLTTRRLHWDRGALPQRANNPPPSQQAAP